MKDEDVMAWAYNEQTGYLFVNAPLLKVLNGMYALLVDLELAPFVSRRPVLKDCRYWSVKSDRIC